MPILTQKLYNITSTQKTNIYIETGTYRGDGIKKVIYINIRGGLGNQLFCYFNGEFIKTKFHVQVNYIYNAKSNVHDKLNSKINSFNLGSDFINTKSLKFYLNS